MNEKKMTPIKPIVVALTALCIVALIGLSASLIVYTQQSSSIQDKNNQIANLQTQLGTPKLVSVGMQYTDNRTNPDAPFLQVIGYVVNVGNAQANNCTLHVSAVQVGNVTALDKPATIPSLNAGAYETINLQLPYTGQALEAYSSYLAWTT